MKKINISKFAAIALIAVGTVFVTGCSKEVGEETVMPGEGTRVVISVGGINEGNSGSFNKVQASAGKSAASAASNGGVIEVLSQILDLKIKSVQQHQVQTH